jgi:pyruvate kinase
MLVQEFGIKRGVDIVTASFVRRPEDIEEFRKVLDEKEQGKRVQIFAKI